MNRTNISKYRVSWRSVLGEVAMVLGGSLLLFAILSIVAWDETALTRLIAGYDGQYVRGLVDKQQIGPAVLGNWNNPLQALGNPHFFNSTLMITYAVPRLLLGELSVVGVVWTASSLLLVAGYVCGRLLNVRPILSLIGGWIVVFLAMPILGNPKLYSIFQLAPHIVEVTALSAICLWLFCRVGRSSPQSSVFALLAIGVLSVLCAYTNIITIVIPAIIMVVGFTALIVFTGDKTVRKWRFLGLVALLIVISLSGMPFFIIGIYLNTVATMLSGQLTSDQTGLTFASMIFSWVNGSIMATVFIGLGIAGAIWSCFSKKGDARIVAIVVAALGLTYILGGLVLIRLDWSGMMPVYPEVGLYPFYAAYIMVGIQDGFSGLASMVRKRIPDHVSFNTGMSRGVPIIVFLSPVMMIAFATNVQIQPVFPHPPGHSPITRQAADALALKAGSAFQGSLITITDLQSKPDKNIFSDFMVPLGTKYGNDHRWTGLWHFNVPTLGLYSQTQTPLFFRLADHFLTRPEESKYRNGIIYSRSNTKILKALGVRMIVTTMAMEDPSARLVATLPADNAGPRLHLYELFGVNLGHYSPTRVHLSTSAKSTLSRLESIPDLSREAVINEPLPESVALLPASSVEMIYEGREWRIIAKSEDTSLLVLPLQYSSCLQLEGETGGAQLIRVNLAQTGILFSKAINARIRSDFGFMNSPGCRLIDWWEADNLNVYMRSG